MSVHNIELLVRLKTADTIALTAKNTLQKDMGYDGTLLDIQREEYWLIEVEAEDCNAARKIGTEFAVVTKTIVNPNKHTYTLRLEKEKSENPPEISPYLVRVLVRYRQDEKAHATLDILRNTLGYGLK